MDDAARLKDALATVERRRADGKTLRPVETDALAALAAVNAAEADARTAFARFYASLPDGVDPVGAQSALPADVALRVGRWAEARKAWDAAAAALLASPPATGRSGPRMRATPPDAIRLPTALPARDALFALFAPERWLPAPGGDDALVAQMDFAQVRVDLDRVLGFGPDDAARQIARHGAAAAQTFLTMIALWRKHRAGEPHESYLTVYASDLLRFQGRKATPRGGYHREDLLAKGRDVYLLSRISIPRTEERVEEDGRRTVKTLTVGRLLSLESLEAVTVTEGDATQSFLRFRYHLSREVHDWVADDHGEFAAVNAALLGYHPIRQKYQILLGFCLAQIDRSRRGDPEPRRIPLPELLERAGIAFPEKRLAAFLTTIEDAIAELARDRVLPGLQLIKPPGWTDLLAARKTREIVARSTVVFSPLDSPPALFDKPAPAR